jgi:hypothetical protein
VSADPVVYSRAFNQLVIDPVDVSSGGVVSPVKSPVHSSVSAAGTGSVLQDGSSRYVWPIYTVKGPCVNPVIANDTTGEAMYFTFTLSASQAIRIDTRPRRRRIDLGTPSYDGTGAFSGATGLTRRGSALGWLSSQWPSLRRGSNLIRVGFTTYSAGAQLLVEWRSAWG